MRPPGKRKAVPPVSTAPAALSPGPVNWVRWIALVFLVPFLVLCVYAYPWADDFSLGAKGKEMGPVGATAETYRTSSGRYFSNILIYTLMSEPRSVASLFTVYKLTVFVLISGVLLAFSLCLRQLFRRMRWSDALWLGVAVGVTYLHNLPSINQGVYWLTGAVNYQGGNIVCLLLLASLARVPAFPRMPRKVLYPVLCGAITACCIGSNETMMVMLTLSLFICTGLKFLFRARDRFVWLIVLVIAAGCFCIVYFAPGNAVRSAYFGRRHQFGYSLAKTAGYALHCLGRWIPNGALLVLTAILVPAALRLARQFGLTSRTARRWAIVPPVLGILTIAAGIFVSFWAQGCEAPEIRAMVPVYLFFLIAWFVTVFMLLGCLPETVRDRKWRPRVVPIIQLVLIVLFCAALLSYGLDRHVWQDAFSDQTKEFATALENRYARMEQARESVTYKAVGTMELQGVKFPMPGSQEVLLQSGKAFVLSCWSEVNRDREGGLGGNPLPPPKVTVTENGAREHIPMMLLEPFERSGSLKLMFLVDCPKAVTIAAETADGSSGFRAFEGRIEAILVVPALKYVPPNLEWHDITTSPCDWINQGVAKYFGLKGVAAFPEQRP